VLSSSADPSHAPGTGLEVRPFRALTYREHDAASLARVSSPAYDLVTPAGRDRLAAADTHNIVRLILPRVDRATADAGRAPEDTAAEAAEDGAGHAAAMLRAWVDEGVLVQDGSPALWLYEMALPSGTADAGRTVGWLGAVALPAAGSRAVLPHEDTYPPAVEGRRALLAATRADLEPIVLAHDPVPEAARLADQVRAGSPSLELTDADGVRHRLWRVADPAVVGAVVTGLRGAGAVIADGHHRFAAARAHHREAPEAEGADAVLALVTPMGAGGLRVEPIHRVLPGLDLEAAAAAARVGFTVAAEPVAGDGPDAVTDAVRGWLGYRTATGFLLSDGRRLVRLQDPAPDVVAALPDGPDAWRGLDVVLAHAGLIERLWHRGDDPASVEPAHDVQEALQRARETTGVALFLRAPSPADVAAVARADARMPRKSTLFVPKPRTGLVLRPHAG
jgi:uncharacterized protein (DUF1015 family)